MSDDEAAAQLAAQLGLIEATNSIADAMTSMKTALTSRGWSEMMAEQFGHTFGTAMMAGFGKVTAA